MNALANRLAARIAQTGPITIADYIAACLGDPTDGYYTTRDPLGADGDFITAPEISQMFGELVGLALMQAWVDQGQPDPFVLAELGPGRGTLMADALRAAKALPAFRAAASIHLVETSPVLRARQAEALTDVTPTWHVDIQTLPDQPLFLIANEFFDALPIRQFERARGGWCERVVTCDETGALRMALTEAAPHGALMNRLEDTRDGDIVETSAPAQAIAQDIGWRIAEQGGAALIIDYGGWRGTGDTFQALAAHKMVDPLSEPGTADLTAHVDFEALARAAAPARHGTLTPQGIFLERLGITQRAQALAARLSGAALDAHIAAHRRLTHPDEMGSVFKVLGLWPDGAPALPGLDP